MTSHEVQAAVSVGSVVKVFFDRYKETVLIVSVDPDGILCRPLSAGSGEAATEFWLAHSQISRIEDV
jgi:hypothetical protein